MKKNFIIPAVLLGAALTVACNKQENGLVIEQGEENFRAPFTLEASLGATKTETEDGIKYTWSEGDALNVFYAKTGENVYSKNVCFNYTAEGNVFEAEGDVDLAEEDAYDWYVLYPYKAEISTPANTETGYLAIGGNNKNAPQVQNGNSNKAHLAGEYFPLYGKATNVSSDEKLKVDLHQALSVVKVHVKNTTGEPLTVSSVSFTAPEDIVGTYFIDFSGENENEAPKFKYSGKENQYVSNVANLNVKGGKPIENDSEADFYIGIKPFVAAAQSEIVVKVNSCEKKIKLSSAATFSSGKIKTINFVYDQQVAAEKGSISDPFSVAEAIEKAKEVGTAESTDIYYVKGKVSQVSQQFTANSYATFTIVDEGSDEIFTAYRVNYLDGAKWAEGNDYVNVGDVVVICGKIVNYSNNTPEITSGGYIVEFVKHAPTVSDVKAEVSEDGKVTFTASYTNKDGVKIEKAGFKYGEKDESIDTPTGTEGEISATITDLTPGTYSVKAYLDEFESASAVVFRIEDPSADKEEPVEIVLDFSNTKTQASKNTNGYNDVSFQMTTDKGIWNIVNANNNNARTNENNNWTYVKIGAKATNTESPVVRTGTIGTTWAETAAIALVSTKVKKSVATATATVKLIVATDENFSDTVGTYEAIDIPTAEGEITFNISNPQKNCYYKLEYYSSSTDKNTNGVIWVYNVTLKN